MECVSENRMVHQRAAKRHLQKNHLDSNEALADDHAESNGQLQKNQQNPVNIILPVAACHATSHFCACSEFHLHCTTMRSRCLPTIVHFVAGSIFMILALQNPVSLFLGCIPIYIYIYTYPHRTKRRTVKPIGKYLIYNGCLSP